MIVYQGNSIRVTQLGNGIAELCFDRVGSAINKFDAGTLNELKAATAAIRAVGGLRGVLVISAKDNFIVGADIFEFPSIFSRPVSEIESINVGQNAAFTTFEDLPVPVVTAINGLALGGGCEMVLASDYRVMAMNAQIGLPEVTLGIFPGFGGTVRLSRLIGARLAIEWIASGKPRNAETALAAGAADALTGAHQHREHALELLENVIANNTWQQRRTLRNGPVTKDVGTEVFAAALAAEAARAKYYPAATAAIKLIERSASLSRDAALKLEHAAFAAISKTSTARALVQVFINEQQVRKKSKSYVKATRPLQRVAVIGAGIMGGGIAYTSAVRGTPVLMKDIAPTALDLGMSEAGKLLQRQVTTGRMKAEQADTVQKSITPTLDYAEFNTVDIVVEAIIENLAVKKTVLAEVEKTVKPDTVIASNTSSLSITGIGSALVRPENFAGMHFFNPVPVMGLVEVIKGEKTSDTTIAAIASYADAMGKTPIVVKDCPGFLVNRVLFIYIAGFLLLMRDGADFRRIDKVMEDFGWPMGPAYLLDVIGMDVSDHVFSIITSGYGERTRLDFRNVIELLAEHKRYGQKTGAGFYRYEADARGRPAKCDDPQVESLLAEVRQQSGQTFSDEEIVERMMLPMVIEAVICLEEQVAESAADIDMAFLLGCGFPRHYGGPLMYADLVGAKHIVESARRYSTLGAHYHPSASLVAMAENGKSFY